MKRFLPISLALTLGACTAKDLPIALPFGLGADAMPETQALSSPIAPVNAPMLSRLRSMKVHNLLNGRIHRLRFVRFGNGIRVREPDGCVWTRSYDWFAPSDSYASCGTSENWHTASATVRREGSIFPLGVGKRAIYERRAVSWNGKKSSRKTECEVVDAVEVLRPSKHPAPAYVVSCDDGRVTRTTWYAPGKGPIVYRETDDRRRVRDAWVRLD